MGGALASTSRRRTPAQGLPTRLALALGALGAAGVCAQGLRVTPSFVVQTSLIETRSRPALGNGLEASLRLGPGVRVTSTSGRVQGSLGYAGVLVRRYGNEQTQGTEWQNSLDASFVAEAVPDHLYLDARGTISQQALSAFGQPVVQDTQRNANRTEVRTVALSPYARGRLGDLADLEVRASGTGTQTDSADSPDSASAQLSLGLASPRGGSRLGWGLNASSQRSRFRGAGRNDETDRASATLSYTPDIDWRLAIFGGREVTNIGRVERTTFDNQGASIQWTPSPRTSVELRGEDRFFGRAHSATIQYRAARTVWRYADIRDINNGADAAGVGRPVTLREFYTQLAGAVEPDATRRDALVEQLLRQDTRDPSTVLGGGAVSRGITAQRRQDASLAYQGVRATLTAQLFRNDTTQLDVAPGVRGDGNFEQTGYAASLAYRLTPQTNVTLGGARTMTHPTEQRAGTDLKTAFATLASQLGRRTNGSLSARYSVFNSPTDPYRETALTASINLLF